MTDSYPKYTVDEIKIWLAHPVTQAYLECLKWYREQLADARANPRTGESNDLIIQSLFRNLGADEGTAFLSDPMQILYSYNLVERSVDEK